MKILFTLFCIFGVFANPLFAEWIQTNGPYRGQIVCIAVSGQNLFAGTWGGGVYRSTDNGGSWTAVNNGSASLYTVVLVANDTNIFAGSYGSGVFYLDR